jgi:hypothetical protein
MSLKRNRTVRIVCTREKCPWKDMMKRDGVPLILCVNCGGIVVKWR